MITDKELLKTYMIGFNDELDKQSKKKFDDKLLQNAYDYGRLDAIVGDDVMELDYESNEEILQKIKDENN